MQRDLLQCYTKPLHLLRLLRKHTHIHTIRQRGSLQEDLNQEQENYSVLPGWEHAVCNQEAAEVAVPKQPESYKAKLLNE